MSAPGPAATATTAAGYTELRALPARIALRGTVVKGFGRGSKTLGIPTANLDAEALGSALDGVETGIYVGWASVAVDDGDAAAAAPATSAAATASATASASASAASTPAPPAPPALSVPVYKMVMSIGHNPYFKNERKTVEPHLLHDFRGADFYGAELRLVLTGFMRSEKNFASLEALVAAIHADIDNARALLDEAPHADARNDEALRPSPAGPA